MAAEVREAVSKVVCNFCEKIPDEFFGNPIEGMPRRVQAVIGIPSTRFSCQFLFTLEYIFDF